MLNGYATEDMIGKYAVYYNGCFARREDLKILGISDCGTRMDLERDGSSWTEHVLHISAIVDNIGDDYD